MLVSFLAMLTDCRTGFAAARNDLMAIAWKNAAG
jgi:hypothetical protein